MNATRYTDNAPALETLKETYIYRIADKLARRVRPTREEVNYIRREVKRQNVSPTGLLLRGWLFDFTVITAQRDTQLTFNL